MIFDYYGVDIRGAIKEINVGNDVYYVGVQYNLTSRTALIALAVSMISLFALNLFTLHISARSLANEVHSVSEGMENIVRKLTINRKTMSFAAIISKSTPACSIAFFCFSVTSV